MKISAILALGAAILPIASGECNWQDVGTLSKKWRLSTYKSKNCISQTGSWKGSGFGVRCIDIPNNTKSFIFTVGSGYNPLNLEDCTIFFKTKGNCGGDQVGRSRGSWKKSSMKNKVAGAYIQCTKLIQKREEEGEGSVERKFVRDDDGEWFEEFEDGRLVKADLVEDGFEGDEDETEEA
ncbi:hypothetical protein FSOLCH5_011226 [Fusarium solani]|jgi:hypothetical protein|uniref:Uncharacterized protein n=1 Tax=Fusarium solani TaxID=169388 RepID=A0A9P9HC28_FUSSL|nr:uncharacterized protein B0J15DRAFT_494879 [Fusarium solani]KAH7254793.1 hypothetical protein B0J15DRAFT_494879 [Fusarium solani]KAJ3456522.1 hypothetical protein MRS44_016545 [Fusarium solani]KAJ4213305.1 hypothetical protein NW759_011147 [Fusarium solani]